MKFTFELLSSCAVWFVATTHDSGEVIKCTSVGRNGVYLLFINELQSMFNRPELSIRVSHLPRVVVIDVAGFGHFGEHEKRVCASDFWIKMTMNKLEELNGEFNIADAAWSAFEFPVSKSLLGDFGFGSCLHRSERAQRFGIEWSSPQRAL
jgi:hypothetical protein